MNQQLRSPPGPMAIPVFGGMILEFLSMLIVPVVYSWWLEKNLPR